MREISKSQARELTHQQPDSKFAILSFVDNEWRSASAFWVTFRKGLHNNDLASIRCPSGMQQQLQTAHLTWEMSNWAG